MTTNYGQLVDDYEKANQRGRRAMEGQIISARTDLASEVYTLQVQLEKRWRWLNENEDDPKFEARETAVIERVKEYESLWITLKALVRIIEGLNRDKPKTLVPGVLPKAVEEVFVMVEETMQQLSLVEA